MGWCPTSRRSAGTMVGAPRSVTTVPTASSPAASPSSTAAPTTCSRTRARPARACRAGQDGGRVRRRLPSSATGSRWSPGNPPRPSAPYSRAGRGFRAVPPTTLGPMSPASRSSPRTSTSSSSWPRSPISSTTPRALPHPCLGERCAPGAARDEGRSGTRPRYRHRGHRGIGRPRAQSRSARASGSTTSARTSLQE